MQKALALVGTTLGGAAGWALGAPAGAMTAFLLSVVGTGAGLYVARRLAQSLLS